MQSSWWYPYSFEMNPTSEYCVERKVTSAELFPFDVKQSMDKARDELSIYKMQDVY